MVRVWLEWIPYMNPSPQRPSHTGWYAITMHNEIFFCRALDKMLKESSQMHAQSKERKMNTRTSDPLAGLQPYQKWMQWVQKRT